MSNIYFWTSEDGDGEGGSEGLKMKIFSTHMTSFSPHPSKVAHFLYVNACMKGEECIPTTWDVFYEKDGFMLVRSVWRMGCD